jgi:hypothetical protein
LHFAVSFVSFLLHHPVRIVERINILDRRELSAHAWLAAAGDCDSGGLAPAIRSVWHAVQGPGGLTKAQFIGMTDETGLYLFMQ